MTPEPSPDPNPGSSPPVSPPFAPSVQTPPVLPDDIDVETQAEAYLTHQTHQLLDSISSVRALEFLSEYHRQNDIQSRANDPRLENDSPISNLEHYFLDTNPSPLLELSLWQNTLAQTDTPIAFLDPTLPQNSPQRLSDLLNAQEKDEIRARIAHFQSAGAITLTLEAPIKNLCAPLFEARKAHRTKYDTEELNLRAVHIFGPKVDDAKKELLFEARHAIKAAQELSELTCQEKLRVAVNALNAPSYEQEQLETQAKQLLGEKTFELLKAQVSFLNEKLTVPNQPHNPDPLTLLSPALLASFKTPPTETQLFTLLKSYQYAQIQNENPNSNEPASPLSPRAQDSQTIGLAIASLSVLEQARVAEKTNFFHEIRTTEPSKTEASDLTADPSEQNKRRVREAVKKQYQQPTMMDTIIKRAVGTVGTMAISKFRQTTKDSEGDYAGKKPFIDAMKQHHGNFDGPSH